MLVSVDEVRSAAEHSRKCVHLARNFDGETLLIEVLNTACRTVAESDMNAPSLRGLNTLLNGLKGAVRPTWNPIQTRQSAIEGVERDRLER